jgi:MarR family transcriptional regulator, 2-MHQ and catechol-resistance regulon repressor
MDFIVRDDGLLTERTAQELAAWYTNGGTDAEAFEAHLMLIQAHASLMTSAQRGRKSGISRERYDVLRALYRTPGNRMPLSELGRTLNVSPASITKLVNALSRAQLAHRIRFPDDKRRMWAELTPKGVSTVEDALPFVIESTKRRWQGLTSEEKRILVHLLAKVVMSAQSSKAETQLKALTSKAKAELQTEKSA